jgi:diguanylate cyclase (GGDEF)-like protein
VTASLGVAIAEPGSDTSVESLLQKADQAMYAAKRKGRNRVEGSGKP